MELSYSKLCLEEILLGEATNHYTFYPFLGYIKNFLKSLFHISNNPLSPENIAAGFLPG